jgi:hypothetical protein
MMPVDIQGRHILSMRFMTQSDTQLVALPGSSRPTDPEKFFELFVLITWPIDPD